MLDLEHNDKALRMGDESQRTHEAFNISDNPICSKFDRAIRNGELSPSDPENRNLLTLRSGTGTRNGVQIRTSRKIWGR